jgi:hypothetical protein
MQDPQENQKFSVQEYAAALREKYPNAAGLSDSELVNTVVEKHPEYKQYVDFGEQPSKKKEDTESPFVGRGGSLQFSPSTEEPEPYRRNDDGSVTYSPNNTRRELIRQFRETTGFSKEDASDGVIAYSAAKIYPELKERLGVRTEPFEVNFDKQSNKSYPKNRTFIADEPDSDTGEINAFKILDEGDPMDFFGKGPSFISKIYNRAIASSEIGKITARSFYGGSIDFDELAYYSKVLEDNEQGFLGSIGETAIGGFIGDVVKTIPESAISLVDAGLSPEALTTAVAGGAAGSAIPIAGTAVGAISGAAFTGSGMLTFGSTLLQKLSEKGVNITDPKELEAAWNNKELLIPLAREAATKGGIVGSFDALSAGLGGTISKSAVKAGTSRISAEFREYAVEGALGGAGEAIGSLAAGDDINVRDVALEMIADPAAGLAGRGARSIGKNVKSVLGENADPDEVKILNRIESNEKRTLQEINISAVENVEQLSGNKTRIEQLQKALNEAPDKKTKRLIKKEIDDIQKENTSIHAENMDSFDEFTDEEIEEMAKDADEIITLARSMKGDNITSESKKITNEVLEKKVESLKQKRGKGGKRRGKRINVSATARETGAPVTVSPEVNEDFIQPDIAQGFEEFMDSEEQSITRQDEINEQNDFEQLKSEIPDIEPEEAPTLVQKRKNKDGKDVETYSQTQKNEDGIIETEYYSEIDGKKSRTGGVVFTKKDGFDKLLDAFNLKEKALLDIIGNDAEAAILTASEIDGDKGKLKLTAKKADGLFEFEVPFTEAAPVQEAPAVTEETVSAEDVAVDDSLSEEGKQAAQALADGMQATVDALKGRDPNTLTEEELQQLENDISSALGREATEDALGIPDFETPPMSAYEQDVMSEVESMSAEQKLMDVAAMEDYFAGEAKQRVLGINYIKQVSDALASSPTKKVDAKIKDTQNKINSSLSKYLKDSLTDAKEFTKFIAENAMQGDFFEVGKALYRVGEVVEEKGKSTTDVDVKNFEDLIKFAGVNQSTSVKDALSVLYRKISNKTITKPEETLLKQFETGRYKGVKNKDISVGDVLTLLDVLRITGKDGDAAIKQAFAMSKDNKVKAELDKILKEYAVVDGKGKPVLNNAGFKVFDKAKAPAAVNLRYMNLLKKQKQIGKMRKLFAERKKGKFAPIFAKENPMLISEYLSKEVGVNTSAGRGGSRTVKFQRYDRKTGEAMPTVSAGKRKEVIGRLKTEFREFKKEQYTATIKDGKLVRKAIKSDRIVDAFGKMGSASYTRFRPEVTEGKSKKRSGARFRRSEETRAKVTRVFGKGKEQKTLSALLLRPKSKSNLVTQIGKVFNLHKDQSEAAAEISDRLIKNMARRAGVPVSEIYDKITFVKNEFKGEVDAAEPIRSSRALGSILRRFGAPISESNLDENGNPINIDKLDQKAKPVTTEFKKYKQKGVEDSFTAQMIEDLKSLGVNVMSMKGDIREILTNITKAESALDNAIKTRRRAEASIIRAALGRAASENKLLDPDTAVKIPYIQSLVKNEIAAYMKVPISGLTPEIISLFELRRGQTVEAYTKSYVDTVRNTQNQRADSWLSWLDKLGEAYRDGTASIEQYSKGFNLVKTVLNFNYSSFNNPENKLVKRTTKTVDNLAPFSQEVADELLSSDDNNPIVDYTKMLIDKTNKTSKARLVKTNSDGTYWAKYKHTEGLSYDEAQGEIDALTFAASQSSWCTAHAAEQHLAGGDFHILFDKDSVPLTAIRIEDSKIVEERGNTPDQSLITAHNTKLLEYKQKFVPEYSLDSDLVRLNEEIKKAREESFNLNLKGRLYLQDIAESSTPQKTLDFYRKKADDAGGNEGKINEFFESIEILEDGVVEFGDTLSDKKVIVPKGRNVTIKSDVGRLKIQQLVVSNTSVLFDGVNDLTIDEILESPSSVEYSQKGYYPQIVVNNKNFNDSSNYGDINYVKVERGIASIAFEEGIGAVEVTEGKFAWITEVAFQDNTTKDGNRFRSLSDIPDARTAAKVITYEPQTFDQEGYFAGSAYDESWGDGARILNQEIKSQLNKEQFIKEHLTGTVAGDLNRFKTKKAANEFIKKHKKDNPALKFNAIKKVMGKDAGMYFISIQRNPKHRIERKVDNEVRASIALVDGQAVIFAMTNPNVSSVVHEMSHMYEEYLTPKEVKVIEKFAGAKRNTEQFSETFARGFERFLADGKAPTPELKSIFSQFKEWMKNIYRAIVGSPIEKDITPEVREIFENMVMVEGDVNFRETGFKTGDIVGPLKGKRKLNQEAVKSGMEKLQEINSNSKKMVAAANSTKDARGIYDKAAKSFGGRQRNIEKYMAERGLVLAESAMNERAGASARAQYKVEAVAKKIYDGLSVKQEDTLNMYLQAERIIQIEKNREEKRNYASEKLVEFQSKKEILLETIRGKQYSEADKKVIEDSLDKIDAFIKRAQEMLDKNRLYKLDKNGIETGELAFKHPNGMTRQDAEAAISQMAKNPEFALIQRRGDLYFNAMSENLKDLYEAELIDKQTYDRFKNQKYITRAFLSHIFNFETDAEGKINKTHFDNNADFYEQIGIGGDQIRALAEGSEGELIVNSRYLLEKAYQSASARVLKNKAAKALAKEMQGKKADWYRDGKYKENKQGIVEDRFGNYTALKPELGFTAVLYKDKGRTRAFYLSDLANKEWNDLELRIDRSFGMKTVRQLSGTGILKAAATGANPLFFLVNVPMDIGHVLFFTDVYDDNKLLPVNMFKVSKNVSKNIRGIVGLDINKNGNISINKETKNTKRTKELLDIYFLNGGGMDFLTQQGQQLFDEKGNMITKPSTRKSIAKALGYTGNVTELAMRLATVEHVINKLNKDKRNGKNNYSTAEIHQIAVAKSRATMDFSKGGLTTKKLDQFVPYLNAAAQGFRVARKYLSTAKGRMNFANKWAQASVGIAMLTFYNMLMSESDEDDTLMDDIPDYIKDNNHVFIHPFQTRDEEGRVNYSKLKKAPQLAPFFNLSESIARATYYRMKGMDDPKKGESIKKQFTRASEQIGNVLPFVPTGSGLVGRMPPTISASIKYISNYDPFRQMNIVSESEFKKVLPSREGLYDNRVPVFLKAFGDATGLSPKRSQAVIESYVTSPTTNFLVGGAYSILDQATNSIGNYDGAKQSKYGEGLFKTLLGRKGEIGVIRGRITRKTTPNWRSYSYDDSQRIKEIEGSVNQDIRAMSGFYAKEYRNAETPEQKSEIHSEMREFALGLEVPADRKRAMESFRERAKADLSKLKNSREIFDIKFSRDPETAARLFDYYFGVPDLRTSEGARKVNERLQYMRSNFDFKASSRFKNEITRISKEKYKY